MKRLYLIFVFFIFFMNSYAQNLLSELLPIEIGMSEFDISKSLYKSKLTSSVNRGFSSKYFRIQGRSDTMLSTAMTCIMKKSSIFPTDENRVQFDFINDKVYIVTIEMIFDKDQIEILDSIYKRYRDIGRQMFIYNQEFNFYSHENSKIKIGEGIVYFDKEAESKNGGEIRDFTIEYRQKNKKYWDLTEKKWKVGADFQYEISIILYDLSLIGITKKELSTKSN